MTPPDALIFPLACVSLAAGSVAIVFFGRWCLAREAARTTPILPTSADVAATEAALPSMRPTVDDGEGAA